MCIFIYTRIYGAVIRTWRIEIGQCRGNRTRCRGVGRILESYDDNTSDNSRGRRRSRTNTRNRSPVCRGRRPPSSDLDHGRRSPARRTRHIWRVGPGPKVARLFHRTIYRRRFRQQRRFQYSLTSVRARGVFTFHAAARTRTQQKHAVYRCQRSRSTQMRARSNP